MVVQDSREGRPAFLLGQISRDRVVVLFSIAFRTQNDDPVFLSFCSGGLVWAVYQLLRRKRHVTLYVLLPGDIVFGAHDDVTS